MDPSHAWERSHRMMFARTKSLECKNPSLKPYRPPARSGTISRKHKLGLIGPTKRMFYKINDNMMTNTSHLHNF